MNNNFLCIGELLKPSDYNDLLLESDNLEIVTHTYGEAFNTPNYTCWMAYKNSGISFTRNTYKNAVFKKLVDHSIEILKNVFPKSYTPNPERVHFIKTESNIGIHKDESQRNCCINIGLFNSDVAITKVSIDGIYENFEKNHQSFVMKDGYGYLLNTNQYHSVQHISNKPRFMLTYGFKEKFETIKNFLNLQEHV